MDVKSGADGLHVSTLLADLAVNVRVSGGKGKGHNLLVVVPQNHNILAHLVDLCVLGLSPFT